jgi:hypothetical protein
MTNSLWKNSSGPRPLTLAAADRIPPPALAREEKGSFSLTRYRAWTTSAARHFAPHAGEGGLAGGQCRFARSARRFYCGVGLADATFITAGLLARWRSAKRVQALYAMRHPPAPT